MGNLFNKLTTLLPDGVNVNIAICKTGKDKFSVSTSFTGKDIPDGLIPFMLKGTADELDANYVKELDAPLSVVDDMSNNIAEFKKAAEAAKKEATKTPAKPTAVAKTPSSTEDMKKKAEEALAKKKAEEEAKQAEKKRIDDAIDKAKAFNRECKYNHAYCIIEKVLPMVTDKKVTKELNDMFTNLKREINSFLVADTADEAKAFVEDLFKPLAPIEEPVAETQEPDSEPEEKTEE